MTPAKEMAVLELSEKIKAAKEHERSLWEELYKLLHGRMPRRRSKIHFEDMAEE